MLQHLRDNSKGLVSGILIGFLVIIFTLSGAESLFNRDPGEQSTVKVNGEKLTLLDVERAIANRRQQMQSRYGDSIPAEFLTEEHLRGPAVESLIERALLVQAASSAGLVVKDESLNQEIMATPSFQNEAGAFDASRYQSLLSNFRYTPSTYKKAIGDDAIINQLSAGIVETSFVTPLELDLIVALNFQTRDFEYVTLSADKVRDAVKIDETEIQAYHAANPEAYTHPEEVAVDYIELSVEKLMEGVEVTEESLRHQYDQNLANFQSEPELQAAHILIESNDAAKISEVSAKLAAGESFESLARTYSDDSGSSEMGGDLGFTTGNTFPESFEAALAALAVGEVSAPVETDAGTHFIKKLSERGVELPDFETERERLAEQLKRGEAENIFANLLLKLKDLSYNAEQLSDVASELGLEVQNTGLFGRFGGLGIMGQSAVINAAFSEDVLQDGNASDVIELAPDRVLVLKKTQYQPSYLRPLEDVREQILAQLTQEKTQELLAQEAGKVKAELAQGQTLKTVADARGLSIEQALGLSRNDPSHDRQLLTHVFSMAKPLAGQPQVDSLPLAQGDYAVVVLNAVNTDTASVPAEQKQAIAAQLSAIAGQNEFRRFQAYLLNSAKIAR